MTLSDFARAAEALDGRSTEVGADVSALLRSFGISAFVPGEHPARATVFELAARFERIFGVPLPELRGATMVGGTIDPRSFGLSNPNRDVSGKSFDPLLALAGCVGEAVEYLSSCSWSDETVAAVRPADIHDGLLALYPSDDRDIVCLQGTSVTTGYEVPVPIALCIRGPELRDDPRTASGYGAGSTPEDAELAAILEVVERDAAALWWHGGIPARQLPLETIFRGPFAESVARGLAGRRRRTLLLEVTTDIGIPVVAAVSFGENGKGLTVGTAANPSRTKAAQAALLELAQMELAVRLARGKLDRFGPGGLMPTETKLIARAEMSLADLRVEGTFDARSSEPVDSSESPAAITRERLRIANVECFVVDLTREELGIPCFRAIAPALQELPMVRRTARLRRLGSITGSDAALPDLL